MSASLILTGLAGLCVGLLVMAFVLAYQENRRLTIALAKAEADVARLKEQRNAAMDSKRAAEAAFTDATRQLDQARRELENYGRAGNRLYKESMEDQQARQLKAAADVATGVEFMVQAIRTLNPELLKRENKG